MYSGSGWNRHVILWFLRQELTHKNTRCQCDHRDYICHNKATPKGYTEGGGAGEGSVRTKRGRVHKETNNKNRNRKEGEHRQYLNQHQKQQQKTTTKHTLNHPSLPENEA